MTTIRVRVQLHNPAKEPRAVVKDFVINRDLAADPIVAGEVLHLDDNVAANLVVSFVYDGDPIVVESLKSEPGMNVDLRVDIAANDGWQVIR